MNNVLTRSVPILAALLVGALTSTSALALPQLSFDDGDISNEDQTGTVSYDGLGGGAVGTDIIFTNIISSQTPLNDKVPLQCQNCLLNFETGANTAAGGGSWTFDGGGSFSLFGTVQDGINPAIISTDTILSGSFSSATVVGSGSTLIFNGFGIDNKHQALLDFYGLTSLEWEFANTEISLGNATVDGDSFFAVVDNADLNNTPIPAPATLGLLGIGVMLIGMLAGRRRMS